LPSVAGYASGGRSVAQHEDLPAPSDAPGEPAGRTCSRGACVHRVGTVLAAAARSLAPRPALTNYSSSSRRTSTSTPSCSWPHRCAKLLPRSGLRWRLSAGGNPIIRRRTSFGFSPGPCRSARSVATSPSIRIVWNLPPVVAFGRCLLMLQQPSESPRHPIPMLGVGRTAATRLLTRLDGSSTSRSLLRRLRETEQRCRNRLQRMEPLWSPVVATGGNQSQLGSMLAPQKQAKTFAAGCARSLIGAHGKEGVDGSSPSEGSAKPPRFSSHSFPGPTRHVERPSRPPAVTVGA